MDLDTRHLRALVAVADEGTFTDAAIALHTSQASVSRSIQRLEATLGHRLFSRSSRHVETTAAGDRVLVHARRLLATLAQLEASTTTTRDDLLVGYAWAALGEATIAVQRHWTAHQQGQLVFVQHNTPTAGLLEGRCEVSVVRRSVTDPRLDSAHIGDERRYAVLAEDHHLAPREVVRLADFHDETVAIDTESGTTRHGLWDPGTAPRFRRTHGMDEWLTLIASGQAVGISSEATRAQHPRPGISYRLVADASPVLVWLAWWRETPPSSLQALIDISRSAHAALPVRETLP